MKILQNLTLASLLLSTPAFSQEAYLEVQSFNGLGTDIEQYNLSDYYLVLRKPTLLEAQILPQYKPIFERTPNTLGYIQLPPSPELRTRTEKRGNTTVYPFFFYNNVSLELFSQEPNYDLNYPIPGVIGTQFTIKF